MFAKRHYQWLARFVGHELSEANHKALSDWLSRDNSKFNRKKFIDECHKQGLLADIGVPVENDKLLREREDNPQPGKYGTRREVD